jgi:hypothetical protein
VLKKKLQKSFREADEKELKEAYGMSLTPVSNPGVLSGTQQVQNQAHPNHKTKPPQARSDTVQLSPAASAQLKGTDADGDGH